MTHRGWSELVRYALLSATLVFAGAGTVRAQTEPRSDLTYDLLVRGGMVLDGSGGPGLSADILIHGGRIAFIGDVDPQTVRANRTIDATGRTVTPGFIDPHAHGNPFDTPAFENFLAMGVTTICLGQDGSSPAGERIRTWMDGVDAAVPGTNIALLVGHGTVRRMAGVPVDAHPDAEQLKRMVELVESALRAGCFGLSTGLEYTAGSHADRRELVAVARPVGQAGGLVMSHMRSEDDDQIEAALDELFDQGVDAGSAVHISHIKVVYGRGVERAEEILVRMQQARERGLRVTADLYPYLASYTGIGIVFPEWAKAPHDYGRVVAERRDELAEYLRRRVTRRNGPEATLLGTGAWKGRTLAEVAAGLGKSFEDVLIDDIGPSGASGAYFVMDDALQQRLLMDPNVMVCTDGSPDMHHPRGYGAFARIIREFVRERGALSLSEAVRKMTGLPARTLGLADRGRLRPGYAADLLIFDPESVTDRATYEEPHQLAEGFDWVIVNGRVVREGGRFNGLRNGQMLRRPRTSSGEGR